jgi:hypothetical protein
VPQDLTVGQFVYVIRKRIKIRPEKAVYVFIDSMCVCDRLASRCPTHCN